MIIARYKVYCAKKTKKQKIRHSVIDLRLRNADPLFIYLLKKGEMVAPYRDCGSFDTRINIFLLKPEQVSSVVKTKNFLHDNYKRLFVTALRFKLHTSS